MDRRIGAVIVLLLLAGGATAHAGTVYVPLPGITTVGNTVYEAQIEIASSASGTKTYKTFSIATGTDGALPARQTETGEVGSNRTVVVEPAASFRGMIELQADPAMQIAARLVGVGATGGMGAYLPVIGSENTIPAGDAVHLLGLLRSTSRVSAMTVVILGQQSGQCRFTLHRADGTTLAATSTLNVLALSHNYYADVFANLVDPAIGIADVRAVVTCDRDFYVFAHLLDSTSGEIGFVGPSTPGTSTLFPPGTQQGCPVGATCVDRKGLLHTASRATPTGRISLPAPAANWGRVRMTIDVTLGPWFSRDSDGKHLAYWWVLNRNFDMFATTFLRGPGRNAVLIRHGLNVDHGGKGKIEGRHECVPGGTYRFATDFNAAGRQLTVTITDLATNQIIGQYAGTPNARRINIGAGDVFLIDMGFREGATPDEVPSYGTTWRDAHIELFP